MSDSKVQVFPDSTGKKVATQQINRGGEDVQLQEIVLRTPAGDSVVDDTNDVVRTGSAVRTDKVLNDTTALTPKFANIACHASGDNDLIAAVASKKLRVLSIFCMVGTATNVYLHDDTPTNLVGNSTDKLILAANGGFVLPFNPLGWFETGSGKKLVANLSAANAFAGTIVYVEV